MWRISFLNEGAMHGGNLESRGNDYNEALLQALWSQNRVGGKGLLSNIVSLV
jgi:hypothetical protein